MENNKTPHILSASSNLLGICFLIVTSLRVLHLAGSTYMDELATVALVLFMASCIFSFLSIRTINKKFSRLYETIADYIFLSGLFLLLIIALLFAFDLIH